MAYIAILSPAFEILVESLANRRYNSASSLSVVCPHLHLRPPSRNSAKCSTKSRPFFHTRCECLLHIPCLFQLTCCVNVAWRRDLLYLNYYKTVSFPGYRAEHRRQKSASLAFLSRRRTGYKAYRERCILKKEFGSVAWFLCLETLYLKTIFWGRQVLLDATHRHDFTHSEKMLH